VNGQLDVALPSHVLNAYRYICIHHQRYVFLKTGPFTSNGLECTAFTDTKTRNDINGAPDIQFHMFCASGTDKDWDNLNVAPEHRSMCLGHVLMLLAATFFGDPTACDLSSGACCCMLSLFPD